MTSSAISRRWPGNAARKRVRRSRGDRGAGQEVAQAASQLVVCGENLPAHQLDQRRRQRAGLVQAQHVDAAHRLDRVRSLDERLAAGQPDDGQRVGDGDHDDQPLRNERDEHGRGADRLDQVETTGTHPDGDRHRDRGEPDEQAHGAHHPSHVTLDGRLVLAVGARRPWSAGWRTRRRRRAWPRTWRPH